MYKIICENFSINPSKRYILHDSTSDDLKVSKPKCSLTTNTTGKLSFEIYPVHPYYDFITKLTSEISLYQDDEWLFTGRILNDEKNFFNVKIIECEGELSYLLDSNQRQAEYHNTSVEAYFSAIIIKHNEMVDDFKKFNVGQITVEDSNDELYRYSNYESTWETIQTKLIGRVGGFLRSRRSAAGLRYIDYVSNYGNVNTQIIDFGKNLLNLTQYVKGESIATAIIPLGYTIPNEDGSSSAIEKRLTIESVNDGCDYIYDADAVSKFGWIFKPVIFDDVIDDVILLDKGVNELNASKLLNLTLTLTAVDLHLLDVNIERIKLGDIIRVVSAPHGIDEFMIVSSMDIDVESPSKSSISLGETITSFTDILNGKLKTSNNFKLQAKAFASTIAGLAPFHYCGMNTLCGESLRVNSEPILSIWTSAGELYRKSPTEPTVSGSNNISYSFCLSENEAIGVLTEFRLYSDGATTELGTGVLKDTQKLSIIKTSGQKLIIEWTVTIT